MFRCKAIVEAAFCGVPATWRADWSDRHMYVCDDHRDYARRAHDGDHTYDQTGIVWYSDDGRIEFEKDRPLS